jgi:hypothetical protein
LQALLSNTSLCFLRLEGNKMPRDLAQRLTALVRSRSGDPTAIKPLGAATTTLAPAIPAGDSALGITADDSGLAVTTLATAADADGVPWPSLARAFSAELLTQAAAPDADSSGDSDGDEEDGHTAATAAAAAAADAADYGSDDESTITSGSFVYVDDAEGSASAEAASVKAPVLAAVAPQAAVAAAAAVPAGAPTYVALMAGFLLLHIERDGACGACLSHRRCSGARKGASPPRRVSPARRTSPQRTAPGTNYPPLRIVNMIARFCSIISTQVRS